MIILSLSTPDLTRDSFLRSFFSERVKLLSAGDDEGITSLHQGLLTRWQRAWYQRLPDQFDPAGTQDQQQSIEDISERLNDSEPWALHDPLLCHVLPLWLTKLKNPLLLMRVSEPLECAVTLQRRWRFPISVGLAIWEYHVLSAARNIGDAPCVSLSYRKLRQKPEQGAREIIEQSRELWGSEFDGVVRADVRAPLQPSEPLPCESISHRQEEILSLLEDGALKRIARLELSPLSRDLLDYYGRLRAGFEIVKAERDELRASNMHLESELHERRGPAEPLAEQEDTASGQNFDCNVTVRIKGMAPWEFVTEADSPILDLLQRSMQTTAEDDQMIFLNVGESGDRCMYFMASSLLSVESTSA